MNDGLKKILITVTDLQKTFKLPKERHGSVRQLFLGIFKKKSFVKQEVLRGISFEVCEGDFFGIIGRNGSGKSTLLKILAGIYTYDSGSVKIHGKISPFLELGVGFNPELSGWENIYLNGALLGLEKEEIDAKVNEIIEFSELREFIDQKLKNYSSGMQVRLAFSVAIHAQAPIILLDEVLAVGDANFQKKCLDVFEDLKKNNKTIIFVTHNMAQVKSLCNKALLIDKGKVRVVGSPDDVADAYDSINVDQTDIEDNSWGNKQVIIESFQVKDVRGKQVDRFSGNEKIYLHCKMNNMTGENKKVNLSVGVYKDGHILSLISSYSNKNSIRIDANQSAEVEIVIESGQINDGLYTLSYNISEKTQATPYHAIVNGSTFMIQNGDSQNTGPIVLRHLWK